MSKKFIPNRHSEFALMADNFAKTITKNPERFHVAAEDVAELTGAVSALQAAMKAHYDPMRRCKATSMERDAARKQAEGVIRRIAHLVRVNPKISPADKSLVSVKERPDRLGKQKRPMTMPFLSLVANVHGEYGAKGSHLIKFMDFNSEGRLIKAKPEEAVRMELFVELVRMDQRVPDWPGQLHGGRNWYLRSYTRSPVRVEYPRSEVPVRVVYWGRWANHAGETGPFSKPLIAPAEPLAYAQYQLPGPVPGAKELMEEVERQRVIITSARRELPDYVEKVESLRAESNRILPGKIEEEAA